MGELARKAFGTVGEIWHLENIETMKHLNRQQQRIYELESMLNQQNFGTLSHQQQQQGFDNVSPYVNSPQSDGPKIEELNEPMGLVVYNTHQQSNPRFEDFNDPGGPRFTQRDMNGHSMGAVIKQRPFIMPHQYQPLSYEQAPYQQVRIPQQYEQPYQQVTIEEMNPLYQPQLNERSPYQQVRIEKVETIVNPQQFQSSSCQNEQLPYQQVRIEEINESVYQLPVHNQNITFLNETFAETRVEDQSVEPDSILKAAIKERDPFTVTHSTAVPSRSPIRTRTRTRANESNEQTEYQDLVQNTPPDTSETNSQMISRIEDMVADSSGLQLHDIDLNMSDFICDANIVEEPKFKITYDLSTLYGEAVREATMKTPEEPVYIQPLPRYKTFQNKKINIKYEDVYRMNKDDCIIELPNKFVFMYVTNARKPEESETCSAMEIFNDPLLRQKGNTFKPDGSFNIRQIAYYSETEDLYFTPPTSALFPKAHRFTLKKSTPDCYNYYITNTSVGANFKFKNKHNGIAIPSKVYIRTTAALKYEENTRECVTVYHYYDASVINKELFDAPFIVDGRFTLFLLKRIAEQLNYMLVASTISTKSNCKYVLDFPKEHTLKILTGNVTQADIDENIQTYNSCCLSKTRGTSIFKFNKLAV